MGDTTFSFSKITSQAAKHGLIGGLVLSSISAIIYVFSINMYNPVFGLVSLVLTYGIAIVFMYRAAAGYRSLIDGPRIDYWSAFVVLLFAGIIIFYISALFGLLLNTVIDPEYHVELIRQFEENVLEKVPEEMRQELLQNTKENLQPMKQFVTSIIATPIVALIMSAIMAFFVRKNPKYKEII